MAASNPYEGYTLARLRAIERDLLKITRDPNTAGYKRRVASRDLKSVRQMMKEKGQ